MRSVQQPDKSLDRRENVKECIPSTLLQQSIPQLRPSPILHFSSFRVRAEKNIGLLGDVRFLDFFGFRVFLFYFSFSGASK